MLYTLKTIKIRLKVSDNSGALQCCSPKETYEIAKNIFSNLDSDQEHMVLFSLDSKNKIRGYKVVASGGQDNAYPDMKIIFRNALLLGAVGIILTHNHPSGDPKPSNEDESFTEKLKEAGDLIGIKVVDHIVIGENKFYSFANEGGLV